ncbi:hypothetical protein B6U74_03050 [Candidatus Bathyarchaeota archaeon ex4484_205]|nr:MAG: hypothetical protein B6U74_03050 [Candidatus Bathyarchaeota archaeon ex4484_205]RLG67363.1 MAG: hypothetical protein DRN93_04665 [archaeon]
MPREMYCPECGALMKYDPKMKSYVCTGCGVMMSFEQILAAREKTLKSLKNNEDMEKKKRREVLKWWLSSKK